MNEMFAALAHPIRSKLFSLLVRSEASARTLSGYFDVSRPAISQHLKILVSSGLVSVHRSGLRTNYSACLQKVEILHQALVKLESGLPALDEDPIDSKSAGPEPIWIRYETTPEGALKISARFQL